ncbi:unnamed protein product [Pedinophyceae sp. YPF-701]|nr:unnamed protein product [Pedinophyceae sp. YPF-701]
MAPRWEKVPGEARFLAAAAEKARLDTAVPTGLSKNSKQDRGRDSFLKADVSQCRYPVVHEALQRAGYRLAAPGDEWWDLAWVDSSVSVDRVHKLLPFQAINHYPGMLQICRKLSLARIMRRMHRVMPEDFNFHPTSFLLPDELSPFMKAIGAIGPSAHPLTPEEVLFGPVGPGAAADAAPKRPRVGNVVRQRGARGAKEAGVRASSQRYAGGTNHPAPPSASASARPLRQSSTGSEASKASVARQSSVQHGRRAGTDAFPMRMQAGQPGDGIEGLFPGGGRAEDSDEEWDSDDPYCHPNWGRSTQPTFILKPNAGAMGRGVRLVQEAADLKRIDKSMLDSAVAQEYIGNPCLVDGRKFDCRVYCLVLSVDPLELHVYQEGLARIARTPYRVPSRSNIAATTMHLTNWSLNKPGKEGADAGGGGGEQAAAAGDSASAPGTPPADDIKKPLSEVVASILAGGLHTAGASTSAARVWASIEALIVKTMIAVQPLLAHSYYSSVSQTPTASGSATPTPRDSGAGAAAQAAGAAALRAMPDRSKCFEVLGFDILLDMNLKPWLVEVNHSPSLSTETPLDRALKLSMLTEAAVLAGQDPAHRVAWYDRSRERQRVRLYGHPQEQVGMLLSDCEEKLSPRGRAGARRLASSSSRLSAVQAATAAQQQQQQLDRLHASARDEGGLASKSLDQLYALLREYDEIGGLPAPPPAGADGDRQRRSWEAVAAVKQRFASDRSVDLSRLRFRRAFPTAEGDGFGGSLDVAGHKYSKLLQKVTSMFQVQCSCTFCSRLASERSDAAGPPLSSKPGSASAAASIQARHDGSRTGSSSNAGSGVGRASSSRDAGAAAQKAAQKGSAGAAAAPLREPRCYDSRQASGAPASSAEGGSRRGGEAAVRRSGSSCSGLGRSRGGDGGEGAAVGSSQRSSLHGASERTMVRSGTNTTQRHSSWRGAGSLTEDSYKAEIERGSCEAGVRGLLGLPLSGSTSYGGSFGGGPVSVSVPRKMAGSQKTAVSSAAAKALWLHGGLHDEAQA